MIRASDARYKSKYQRKQNDILDSIEKEINKAIDNGAFECKYSMSVDVEQDIRNAIQKILESLGYQVSMPEKKDIFGPCEQVPWYDTLVIIW